MIKYKGNKTLKEYQRIFGQTNAQVAETVGLTHVNSVIHRRNGTHPLTGPEIAAICNESEKLALFDNTKKPYIFVPTDFYEFIK